MAAMKRARVALAIALGSGTFALGHDLLMQPGRSWSPAIAVALLCAMTLGIVAFALGRATTAAAALVLALATAGSVIDALRIGGSGEHHAKYLPFIALSGWLIATLTRQGPRAWDAAAGAVGGAYVVSGISKLSGSGLAFVQSGAVALLIAERADPVTWLGRLRMSLAESPPGWRESRSRPSSSSCPES